MSHSSKSSDKILITGASGQIGSDLTTRLVGIHGQGNVILSDLRPPAPSLQSKDGYIFKQLDVTNAQAVRSIIADEGITQVYHLAALLSATGEGNPQLCWKVNMEGFINVLEAARESGLRSVVCPSSIAVFGPNTQKENTPQEAFLCPTTMYGVTKVAGEAMADYYYHKYGLDVRGLRYPGLISHTAEAGGGTTDYAVEIFYEALKSGEYTSFLSEDTVLPMMYMPDAINALITLQEAPREQMRYSNYNIAAISFSVKEMVAQIQRHIPEFKINYKPDHRQQIADSWPKTIDDSAARRDWGWSHQYTLKEIVPDMLSRLRIKLGL